MGDFLQNFGTNEQELKLVEELASRNWKIATEADKDTAIGFEHNGMFISNIFMDESARFPLTLEEAVKTYGYENVSKFYYGLLKASKTE